MNRQMMLIAAASSALVGCYAEYVAPTAPPTAYVEPSPVTVSVAPPAPRYEAMLSCGYGQTWIGGYWDWNGGGWNWQPGYCQAARAGYVWVPPVWRSGVYVRGYWGPTGRVYGGGTYVAPAPAYRPAPAYVPPPAPVYRPAPTYVAPPAPAYRPAPAPAPMYRPAPAPAAVVPPPAPVYRPVPR